MEQQRKSTNEVLTSIAVRRVSTLDPKTHYLAEPFKYSPKVNGTMKEFTNGKGVTLTLTNVKDAEKVYDELCDLKIEGLKIFRSTENNKEVVISWNNSWKDGVLVRPQ